MDRLLMSSIRNTNQEICILLLLIYKFQIKNCYITVDITLWIYKNTKYGIVIGDTNKDDTLTGSPSFDY